MTVGTPCPWVGDTTGCDCVDADSSYVVVVSRAGATSCAFATRSNSRNPAAGPPQLMMSLTEDGMLDPELVKKRDADYGISTEASCGAARASGP